MSIRTETLQRWWPTTQSLDLVEGSVEKVAAAVQAEVARFVNGEEVATSWEPFHNLDAAFGAATEFHNVPTFYLVLPTWSRWTVLWNNSFLCDGYDSLCWCLTNNHGITTMHWSAHDEWTTFQSGAVFYYRRRSGFDIVERYVQTFQEDKRWLFSQSGEPLPEEDVAGYATRRKRDRLNEERMSQLLARLGAFPWQEQFYALPQIKAFVLRRIDAPSTITRKERDEVLRAS